MPPAVAIGLAMITRRIVLSLLAGVAAGSLILARGNLLVAVPDFFENRLWASLIEADHLRVFVFTTLMGVMVGLVSRSGGMHGLIDLVSPLARNRRRGQLTGWIAGGLIFFDDYANSLLLGSTLRPITDRLKISREKLAYIVDSTAAPVSGLALISTWVAGEIGYIQSGLDNLDLAGGQFDAFRLFLVSIPYRFYVLWTLAFVGLVAWLGRDFGPMLRAEREALNRREPLAALDESADETNPTIAPHLPKRWINAALPVAAVVGVVLWLLLATGHSSMVADQRVQEEMTLINVMGAGDSYLALVYGSLAGALTAAALALGQRLLSARQCQDAAVAGARLMAPALAILWLAWALSGLTDGENLQLAAYLTGWLEGQFHLGSQAVTYSVPAQWMPTIVFVLASAVAFGTGTSWGTMSILMPVVVETTYLLLSAGGATVAADDPVFVGAIAGVLAGAIFGDHCSPISDTTVLSSRASGCDHLAHVWTQMPYALLVAVVSILLGTLPIGYGLPVWPLLVVGCAVLAVFLLVFGSSAEAMR